MNSDLGILERELSSLHTEMEGLASKHPERGRTFCEVIGFPNREIYASNLLAHLLSSDEDHSLGDLWVRALLVAIGAPVPDDAPIETSVEREYGTIRNGAIDLVVHTPLGPIGIENKLFAVVQNDLRDYRETVESLDEAGEARCVLLHLSSQTTDVPGWVSLTYKELFDAVRTLSGRYYSKKSAPWFVFMDDFMKTMERMVEPVPANMERIAFLGENASVISEVASLLDEGYGWAKRRCGELAPLLEGMIEDSRSPRAGYVQSFASYAENRNRYASVYTDVHISDGSPLGRAIASEYGTKTNCDVLAVEMFCDYEGWRIGYFPRGRFDGTTNVAPKLDALFGKGRLGFWPRGAYQWKLTDTGRTRPMDGWHVSPDPLPLDATNKELAQAFIDALEDLLPLVTPDSPTPEEPMA